MFNYGFIKLVILFTLIVSWGTRAQETLDWLNDIPVGGWPGATLGPHSNNTVCHSRGTLTAQHFNPFNLILPSGTPFAFAINNNSIIFGTSATPAGRGVTQTLNFSYPVENLTFSVFDIDGNNGNWQDRIIITASLAGNAVPITIVTCPTVAGTVCMGSGTNTVQIDAGITPTGFAAANGRGDISIAGALDAVVIQYQNHTVPVSTTGFISLTQLTYNCAIIGVSKLMTRRVGQALGVSPYIVDIDFNFENFGDVTLSALTALDDLQTVFNTPPNINNYSVSSITTTSGPVTFNANAAFNGNTVQELIAAGSSLAAGQTASIRVTLAVNNYDSYNNSITLTATTPQGAVTADNSFNGTDPDGFNGDNNPDESSISNLNTTSLPVSLNYISSNRQNNNILIQWQTDIEFEHIGFVLYQEDGGGDKYPLSDLITSSNETSKQGLKNYQFRANSQSNAPIWLLEYSNKGTEKWYGPFAVNASVGEKITATKIAWQRESSPEQNSIATTELAIAVTQTGMQRIHYADLVDAGLDLSGKRPSQLAIALGEQSIAIYINGDPEVFNNQSSFDFYAENIDSLYTNSRIYHLSFKDKEQKLIAVNSTVATTSHDAWHWQSLKYNPNVIYDFSSASADPWRAETLATFANSSFNKPFQLSHVLDNSSMTTDSNIQLRVKLSGAIDYQQPPEINPTDENRCGANAPDLFLGMPNDHCLKLTVNDHQYAEIVFDGLRNNNSQYSIDVNDLEQELLLVGLDLPGQTGYDYDIVNIEEISIKYPRQLYAKNNLLDFSIANSKTFESDIIYEANFESNPSNDEITNQGNNKAALVIKGFSNENIVAYALDRNHPKRIAFVAITESMGQFNAKIPAIANSHHYWVSTEEAMLKPQLQAWKQGSEFNPEGVEYIIIAHEDFIQGSQRIKAHHQAHGLNTAIINVNDIYAKYSASVIDPYAIKAFIAELSKNNSLKYILLVGSDNYDYKGYLSDTHFSHIPSIYTAIDDVVRHAPADSLYADIDADDVPDFAIGRLPVRNNQELQRLIDKQLLFYAQMGQNSTVHFIADGAESTASYADISDALKSHVPDSWRVLDTYRDNFMSASATKQQILDYFSLNPRLTTYIGHSGPRNWFSFPSAFTFNDIPEIDSTSSSSVIMQWGCWNSYYVEPNANTMAHRFLFSDNMAAVAVFGASALTSVASEQALADKILPELFKQQSIGQAMLKAKQQLAAEGQYRDVVIGWNLLGDPAIQL